MKTCSLNLSSISQERFNELKDFFARVENELGHEVYSAILMFELIDEQEGLTKAHLIGHKLDRQLMISALKGALEVLENSSSAKEEKSYVC